jgi:RNA polymerase sigma-70 factor (ECF subfamily)
MPMELSDDELLVAGVDDVEAFAAFYRRHAAPLAGFFLARTGNRELAADLTAETFAAALAARRRFDPAKGPAVGWLYGIARHKLMKAFRRGAVEDRARRRLRMGRLVLDDEALEQIEITARATQLLDGLPDDQRAAVAARVIEERDYAEIAAATQTSESVIRKRVSRGLSGLRKQIEEEPA